MSLVLDNLKKITKQSGDSSVPPGMINLMPKKKKKGPNKMLLILLGVSLVGFALTFLIDSGAPEYNVAPPVKTVVQAQPPLPATTPAMKPVPKPAPEEKNIQQLIDTAVKEALAKAEAERVLEEKREKAEKEEALAAAALQKKANSMQKAPDLASVTIAKATAPVRKASSAKPKVSSNKKKEYDSRIQYNTLVALADRALVSGQYERAVGQYQQALDKKVEKAVVLNLIKAELGAGDLTAVDTAMRKYNSTLNDEMVSNIALSMNDNGYGDKAISTLGSYVGRFDSDVKLYYSAGIVHEQNRNYLKAEKAYLKASELLPADAYYAYAYARILDIEKKYEEAIEAYMKVTGMQADSKLSANAETRAKVLINYVADQQEQMRLKELSEKEK